MIVSPLNWFPGLRVLKVHGGPVKQKTQKTGKTGHRCQVAVFRSSGALGSGNKQTHLRKNSWMLFLSCRALEISVLPRFCLINTKKNADYRLSVC
ncbi:hypothetical protein LP417_13265 [Polaromonas sp. P1-6]|nr:hypothetical protein LP417_13265 [Polaromonas sp. P1-6]